MLSRNLFGWAHKIALFAIIFASLAPSISHALANQNGTQGIMQSICGVGGQKLYIQVVTTKGQSIQAALDTKPGSQPVSINHHLNHCPFCTNPNTSVDIETSSLPIIKLLVMQEQYISTVAQPISSSFSVLPPPAQAPPSL